MSVDRREFLAAIGGLGAGLSLGAFSHWLPLPSPEMGPDWSPGREEFVRSCCMLCPAHCGVRGRILDGKLVRIEGNPLHPVNRGGLCPKGYAGIQMLYHPARLTGPVERTGPPGSSEFRLVSWDAALGRIAEALSNHRAKDQAGSVAWLTGDVSGIMRELIDRFAGVYGTSLVMREDYEDGSAEVLRLTQGIRTPPAFDLEGSDFVLSFGAGLSESWWSPTQAARARDARAGRRPRWVQVDVRHSRTAARADQWVPVRPGAHGALALGIAYVILKEGLYDERAIHERVEGLEDWRDGSGRTISGYRSLVQRYGRTEEIAGRTGIPSEDLVRLAKAFATAERPVALWDQSISWREGGLADAMAIHALNVLVGALNRPGGVLVQPPIPVPGLESLHPGGIGRGGSAPSSDLSISNWAERAAGTDPSPLNALFLYYANPVASSPDPDSVKAALQKIPLVISFSPFLDESARYADLVLPDHTYMERWQDAPAPSSVPIPVWGIVQPMSEPLHDTRATGDVILDLASRLGEEVGARFPWKSVEEIVRERGRALARANRGNVMVSSFHREEMRELEARGWWLPHGKSAEQFWTGVRESGGWFDPYYDYHDRSSASQLPDGRVRIFPAEAREAIRRASPPLVEGFLPLDERSNGETPPGEKDLLLVPYRVMTLASGGTALMPFLLENLGVLTGDAWETWAEINPGTGEGLGLESGQRVRIESDAGDFTARLRFFAGAQPGVVNVPYGLHASVEGWGQADGANPLRAVGARRDPATGLPDWYSTRVRIVPA